jgi:hypothetical protein
MSLLSVGALTQTAAILLSGCSFGAFQTAHTQAPATVSVTPGIAQVFNGIDDEQGRGLATNVGAQLGGRVGLTERLDAGVGTFLSTGVKLDAKLNVLDPLQKLAVAPRIGAGRRWIGREIWMVEGGAIASYRVFDWLEPYLGLTFANHWIEPEPPPLALPPDALGSSGSGDGLLQLSVGVELAATRHFGVLAEYGHWFVLNNDPGDYYRFLPTNIAGLAVRIGRVRR